MSALDVQTGGDHYKRMKIQPIEYTIGNNLGFIEGNIIKYITRHRFKNGAEDIKKIIHYCELLLELVYNENKMASTEVSSDKPLERLETAGERYRKELLRAKAPARTADGTL